jgi:putative DNA primase/helicase
MNLPQTAYAFLERLAAEKARNVEAKPAKRKGKAVGRRGDSYAMAALRDECQAVAVEPEKNRNNRLNVAAYNLGQLVGAKQIARSKVETDLAAAARKAGLGERETIATIKSGLDAGEANPRDLSGVGRYGDPPSKNGDGNPQVNEASDDPHRLARIHLKECQFKGKPTRQFYRGEMLEWTDGAYRALAEAEAQSRLTRSIKAEFDRLNINAIKLWKERSGKGKDGTPEPKPQARKVGRSIVSNATLAMESMTLLPGRVEAPAWINGQGPFDPTEVIPFRNALVHLPSFVAGTPGAIITPTPSYFCPYVLDYDFAATAPPTPEFDRFLASVWQDDPESAATLLEFIGYLLSPDTQHHKILLLVGPMRSGRGTIARLIRSLIGPENVAAPTLEGMADSFGMASLIGKPVAIIGDARVSARSPHLAAIVERLLGISGEDTCTIPRKYLPDWTGKLPTRLVILSNELPRLPDQAGALASRYLVLRFTESFIGREDKQLDAKLHAERPGIVLKAIDGWKRLRDRGHFIQPKSGESDCNQLRDISSPVGAYVRDRLIIDPKASADVEEVFSDWCEWCERKRQKSGDESTFGRNLRSVVPKMVTKQRRAAGKTRVRVFGGLRLRTELDPSPDDDLVSRDASRDVSRDVSTTPTNATSCTTPPCEVSRCVTRDTLSLRDREGDGPREGDGGAYREETSMRMSRVTPRDTVPPRDTVADNMDLDPHPF